MNEGNYPGEDEYEEYADNVTVTHPGSGQDTYYYPPTGHTNPTDNSGPPPTASSGFDQNTAGYTQYDQASHHQEPQYSESDSHHYTGTAPTMGHSSYPLPPPPPPPPPPSAGEAGYHYSSAYSGFSHPPPPPPPDAGSNPTFNNSTINPGKTAPTVSYGAPPPLPTAGSPGYTYWSAQSGLPPPPPPPPPGAYPSTIYSTHNPAFGLSPPPPPPPPPPGQQPEYDNLRSSRGQHKQSPNCGDSEFPTTFDRQLHNGGLPNQLNTHHFDRSYYARVLLAMLDEDNYSGYTQPTLTRRPQEVLSAESIQEGERIRREIAERQKNYLDAEEAEPDSWD